MRANQALYNLAQQEEDFLAAVWQGLGRAPKTLPCRFFYDQRGSALFDAICNLDEYYLTRTELGILKECAADIARLAGPTGVLLEYGSGSSIKTRLLLDALAPQLYMPIDISRDHMLAACAVLEQDYPRLQVRAVCADYSRPFALPAVSSWGRTVAFFPGSSIGNFDRHEAVAFLRLVRGQLHPGDALVLGVDLQKDVAILEAAYNDAQGVSAAFNLNLLARINRELGADFDLNAFEHRAWYNEAAGRMEMHLVCTQPQQVRVNGRVFVFDQDETIHTENSHKFNHALITQMAFKAGLEVGACWSDPDKLFAVYYLVRKERGLAHRLGLDRV